MNDSFYIGPHFMLTFGYVMHAVSKQGCILPAEKEEGQVYSHCNWVQRPSSEWLRMESVAGGTEQGW